MRIPRPKSLPGLFIWAITVVAIALAANVIWVVASQNIENVSAARGYDKLLQKNMATILAWLSENMFWMSLTTAAVIGAGLALWIYVIIQPSIVPLEPTAASGRLSASETDAPQRASTAARVVLTSPEKERCSIALREVHDFVGGELIPFLRDLAEAQQGTPRVQPVAKLLKALPSLMTRQEELDREAGQLWHRNFHYLDLMKFDIMPVLQAVQALRNPLLDAEAARDWPAPAQEERHERVFAAWKEPNKQTSAAQQAIPGKRQEYIND